MKTSPGNEHIVDLMSVAAAQRRQENDLELTHHFAAAPGAQCVEGAAVDVFAHKAGRAIAQEEVNQWHARLAAELERRFGIAREGER